MNIYEKLTAVQNEIKAPKSQYNDFGKYNYRSCEDICTALKPLLDKHKLSVYINDMVELIGERYYIKATVTLVDTEKGDAIVNAAFAREEQTKKGMDSSQITGSTSSYARKYALAGLFLIDDTVDSDGLPPEGEKQKEYKCVDCGKPFEKFTGKNGKEYTEGQAYHIAEKYSDDGKARCKECRDKKKGA